MFQFFQFAAQEPYTSISSCVYDSTNNLIMQERYLLTNQPLFATTKKRYFHPKREETPHSRKLKKTKERKSMYTKMMWLTFIFLVGMAAGVFAVEVEVAEDGTLRATETQGWKGTGVSISDDARQYAAALQEAYKTPGKRVPVKTHREYKPRWPEITVTTIADTAVVYDEKERRIHLVTSAFVAETETSINLFLLSLGIAVLLMLVSNIFFWR